MPSCRRAGVARCTAGLAMCVVAAAVPAGADVLPLPLDPPARVFAWGPDVQDYHVRSGLAVDREGNAFVSDETTVWKVSSSGSELGRWTVPDGATAFVAEIEASPDGELLVLDDGNKRVLRYGADATLVDSWVVPLTGYLLDMSIDASGNVYLIEQPSPGSAAVHVYGPSGEPLRSWGVPYAGGVAVHPNGELWVAAYWSLLRFAPEGQQLEELALGHPVSAVEIAIDAGGNLCISGGSVHVLTPNGFYLTTITISGGSGMPPSDLAIGPGGEIFVLPDPGPGDWLLKFEALPSGVAVTSDPPGRSVFLDGEAHTTPLFHSVPTGSEHTYSVLASEEAPIGTRHDFTGWSDGFGEFSRTLVTGVTPTALHASFDTFCRLTTTSTPGGTVTPGSGWYPKGSIVELRATPTGTNQFLYWGSTRWHDERNPITPVMDYAQVWEAVFAPGNFELSISASDNDPFVHAAPAAGVRNLYLWLTASEPGIAALEADVLAGGSLEVFGFTAVGGTLNVQTAGDLLLAIPSCPSGAETALLLGYWTVMDGGGSLCLQPSEWSGTLGAVDCRQRPALWDVRVQGFASDGPPCLLGPAHDLAHRPALAEGVQPLTPPLGAAVTALHAPYPNPFRGESVLGFSLAGPSHASVVVYDVAGRLVRKIVDRPLPAGVHSAAWNGRDEIGRRVASGTYFVRLETGEDSRTRKIVLLKSE
ncbi:MAG: FlgD immunoglobulin-like domain containing protein [bacterium]